MSMWVGIEKERINLEEVQAANLLYDDLPVASPVNANLIVFPEEAWIKVQEMFSLPEGELIPTNLHGTVYYQMSTVSAKKTATEPRVTVLTWNGQGQVEVKKVVERMLLPLFNKNIVITYPHGMLTNENNNPKEFHVRFWSQASERSVGLQTATPPEKLWGIPVDYRETAYLSTEKGIAVIDSSTGFTAGELMDNTLFIHLDLFHISGADSLSRQLKILEKIFEFVIMIRANPGEYERIKQERELALFVGMANRVNLKKMEMADKNMARLEKQQAEYRGYLVAAERELIMTIKERAYFIEHGTEIPLEEVKLKWKQVKSIDEITGVKIQGGALLISTVPIIIPYDGKRYTTGPFDISINFESAVIHCVTSGKVGTRNKHPHPHISTSGQLCMGNLSESINAALVNYEFLVVIELILILLHSYTSTDAYEQIVYFPQEKK